MSTLTVQEALADQHDEILRFYDECGYPHGLEPADLVLTASSAGVLIGAVRLSTENNVLVLRGMQVLPAYQRQGVGKQLLEACLVRIRDSECYCIPWRHLEAFYGAGGFARIDPATAPIFLAERCRGYLVDGYDVILMRRRKSV